MLGDPQKEEKRGSHDIFENNCSQYISLSFSCFQFRAKAPDRVRHSKKRHSSGFILTEARFKDVKHSQELCVTMWCMSGSFWCVALLDSEAHRQFVLCRSLLQATRHPKDLQTNTSPSVVNIKFMCACFTFHVPSNSSILSKWSLSVCPTQGGACGRVQARSRWLRWANAHNARS